MCNKLIVLALSLCVISSAGASTIVWDFENGDTHRFILQSTYPAAVGIDDPNTAGDEAITGAGGFRGLPDAGIAWTVGPPTQFDGLKPAVDVNNARVDASGLLDYSLGTERIATESGTLNTYNLNQHGDNINTQENDQIASSPAVLIQENAVLSVWSWGGGSGTHAPEYDPDSAFWYTDGSSGIAVISAEGDDQYAILATLHLNGRGTLTEDTLDLSAFAGRRVFIDVVDAFQGSWGWLAVDKIQITNAIPGVTWDFENGNDHDFVLRTVKPATPAPDDPNTAGDEALTGGWEPGNLENLPEAGLAWTIGAPEDFDGLYSGADPGRREDGEGKLRYINGKQRIMSGHGSLNTYCLNFHGDWVHTPQNDQIATSPPVLLFDGAVLTIWSSGGGSDSIPPVLDPDPNAGYVDNSGGLVVLSAEDGSMLTSLWLQNKALENDEVVESNDLDLSAFAGQTVIFEVVDAYEGGWGWISVDEIQITNAIVTRTEPDNIAGLLAWYDAQAITGVADGGAVARWPDKSGNGRDATQDDDMHKPVYVADTGNGLPAVRFDTDWLEAVFSADGIELPITVFVVHKVTSETLGNQNIIDGGSTGSRFRLGYNPPGEPLFATFQNWPPALNANIAIETPMPDFTVATALYNEPGARSALRVDGEEKASSESMASHRLVDITIASRYTRDKQWFFGDIAEMIFYERALEDGELATVESYLANKYGFGLAP